MAWDPAIKQMVLLTRSGVISSPAETWIWAGNHWAKPAGGSLPAGARRTARWGSTRSPTRCWRLGAASGRRRPPVPPTPRGGGTARPGHCCRRRSTHRSTGRRWRSTRIRTARAVRLRLTNQCRSLRMERQRMGSAPRRPGAGGGRRRDHRLRPPPVAPPRERAGAAAHRTVAGRVLAMDRVETGACCTERPSFPECVRWTHHDATRPTTRAVTFPSRGSMFHGYLAMPDGAGPHPGVVVIHEAFGLTDNIRDITRRFASEGYAALAVDLFTDHSRAVCMAGLMGSMLTGRDPSSITDFSAAMDHLVAEPEVDRERIGAIGFCMGGGFAIAWGRRDNRLRAIAPFYGTNPRAARSGAPHVSGRGQLPGQGLHRALRPEARHASCAAGCRARHQGVRGRRATRSSTTPAGYITLQRPTDAWRRTLEFFAEHVQSPRPSR